MFSKSMAIRLKWNMWTRVTSKTPSRLMSSTFSRSAGLLTVMGIITGMGTGWFKALKTNWVTIPKLGPAFCSPLNRF